MPEARELRSVIEAAEQAAAAGDYASAERHLREAAHLQETWLGPLHPDLANTLNNLGVVYEMADRPADAEDCYRRAYAIAVAALEPDHPFVVTSGNNLRDFREARGQPVESPTSSPAVRERELPKRWSRPLAVGALTVFALVLVIVAATRPWFSSSVPTSEPPPGEPIPAPKRTGAGTSGPERARAAAATAAPGLSVVDAWLCRNLSVAQSRGASGDWRCDRASSPIDPGALFYYTRIKSASDTTVEHRWYLGDRLQQAVELRVQANLSGGYRTYSRNTVNAAGVGNWRVELRTKDGERLHEERFVVR